MGWVGGTHTMRYHAHYKRSGQGHVYQKRYKSFPIQDGEYFLVVCRYGATRNGRDLSIEPKIIAGARCGGGSSDPNRIQNCSPHGPLQGYQDGSIE